MLKYTVSTSKISDTPIIIQCFFMNNGGERLYENKQKKN